MGHYVNRLVAEVKHIKMGSPLRQSYPESTVDMYRLMKPRADMDLVEVLEKDRDVQDENQPDEAALQEEKNKMPKYNERKAFVMGPKLETALV